MTIVPPGRPSSGIPTIDPPGSPVDLEAPMPACAFCERPLICEACRTDYQPSSPDAYQALSWPEQSIACPSCGAGLVCHWCKTPYDGTPPEAGDEASSPPG